MGLTPSPAMLVILLALLLLPCSAWVRWSPVLRPAVRVFAGTTPLTAGGKRVEATPGSSMLEACKKLGLKVPLDCRKGDCGTCTVTVGGQKVRACVGKVPPAPRLKSLQEKGLAVSVDN